MSIYYRQASVQSAITGWIESGEYQYTNATDYLRKRIVELPPADVAPVVHGAWVHSENGKSHCSECGYTVYRKEISPYCPYCGAKMDTP